LESNSISDFLSIENFVKIKSLILGYMMGCGLFGLIKLRAQLILYRKRASIFMIGSSLWAYNFVAVISPFWILVKPIALPFELT
jgi:hypothetical protein